MRQICTLGAFFLIGGLVSSRQPAPKEPELDAASGEVLLISGCIFGPVSSDGIQARFPLELEAGADARITLTARPGESLPLLEYGQRIEVEAKVRKPKNFGNPGAFDFVGYLHRQSVYWLASAWGANKITVLPGNCGSNLRRSALRMRAWVAERGRQVSHEDFMPALLVGDNALVTKRDTADFRRTGTYHAIVVSGLHITVVAGTALALLRFFGVPLSGLVFLGSLLAWTYAAAVDWQPPVVRSALGFTLLLTARWFHRQGRLLNLLGLTGILLLALDPTSIYDPSFQLTFLSVAAIGAIASPLIDILIVPYRDGTGPRGKQFRLELSLMADAFRAPLRVISVVVKLFFAITELIVVSASVQLALLVPSVAYFHQASATSVLANIFVVPSLSAAVPIGLAAALSGSTLLGGLAAELVKFARHVAALFSRLEPGLRVPDFPLAYTVALLAVTALLGYCLVRRSRWAWLFAAIAPGVVFAAITYRATPQTGALELAAIDVGQGDSLFITFPNGRTLLVDAGGFPIFDKRLQSRLDIGEDVVSPYLWHRGLRTLDYVAVTHLHDDHAAGIPAVIRNFRPREVWLGLAPEDSSLLRAIRNAAAEVGTRVVGLRTGDTRDNVLQVLWPARDMEPGPKAKNDDSLVILLTFGANKFLLMGDAERPTEFRIDIPPDIDVLKAGHHGSRTSSNPEFLAVTRPLFTLISSGEGNSYGHPNSAVLSSLEQVGTRIFRTDRAGAIQVLSDGRRITITDNRANDSREMPALTSEVE